MRHRKPTAWMYRALWLTTAFVFAACTNGTQQAPREDVGEVQSAAFTNGGFETGTAGVVPPAPWVLTTFTNPNNTGYTPQTPQTLAGLNLQGGGNALTTTLNGVSQPDPDLGATTSLRWPRYGSQCARVNFHSNTANGNGRNVNQLSQTMTVGAADVDPVDGKVHVRFVVAPVLEDPAHPVNQQPYFFVQLTNVTQANAVLYTNFNFSNQAGVPWKTLVTGGATPLTYRYTDWQLVDISPGSPAINMGDQIQILLIAAGCSQGAHEGQLYVDGVGSTVPGLFVSGTGPAQANPGTDITYNMTYKNGSVPVACTTPATCALAEACVGGFCAETGAVIDFTMPPGTTFQSFTAPPGATCVAPPVGSAGTTLVCTFTGPIPPGGSGSFTVTVNIDLATTGVVTAGTYDIHSTQETPLLGNKIDTEVGCLKDADCPSPTWCKEAAPSTCTPKLPNGTAIPNDPGHTGPTLNGTCTGPAATLVCVSGVCDTTDNKCGFLNGDGTCTVATQATVCRSGVCDPADGKCGLAIGDGTCTVANGPAICRSGACSVNGKCEPFGGCNVDLDCTGGKWCNESTHACTPKLPNGTALPIDGPHTGPTLDGTCTTPAATLVCASGVCDPTDNKCGLLNGDGTCSVATGATVCRSGVCDPADSKCGLATGDGTCTVVTGPVVCRSGVCSVNGKCEPAGGCNVDGDCTGGNWCNETMHLCTPKLANGTLVPVDGPHMGPTLDGTCTDAAATLVCASGVCDTNDNECGYANSDGPCTAANGDTVCRSGACSVNLKCEPLGGCNVDGDCTGGKWCNETMHMCLPTVPNGTQVPSDGAHTSPTLDGTCTDAAGALTCQSAVCDTNDNKCGYADGDGPCTAANSDTVCRSGFCSVNLKCEPAGGCNVDADCTAGDWCNESMHECTPTLANGTAVPTDGPHTNPTLDGTCSAAAGTLVCTSGVCDTKDNECGYANGDGPCTDTDGATVCRSTICATSGANMGNCVACLMDSQCPGAGAKCNTTTNTCVQCTDSSQCMGATPICDTASSTCVPCDGDANAGSPHACSAAEPFCFLSGSMAGVCGKCALDSDCEGHTGNICDAASGLCVKGCHTDAECTTTQWCDAAPGVPGMCVAKLDNGTPLPTTPTDVAKCSDAVGSRVCKSGVCDTKDNDCGFANGDGPCASNDQCRNNTCDTTRQTCSPPLPGCKTDEDCPAADFCTGGGTCLPRLPDGSACDEPHACQSGDCRNGVCNGIIATGNGLVCTVSEPGSSSGDATGLLGLVIAAAGIARSRRRRSAP